MSDRDLTTLVRRHGVVDEPPFAMSPDPIISRGRRRVRVRRLLSGSACVAVVAVLAAVAVPRWIGDTAPQDTALDPAVEDALDDYDAHEMPRILEEEARAVFARSVPGLGPAEFFAGDGQGQKLPPELYDKASGMSVSFGGDSDHRLDVSLLHAGGEAEGDHARVCAEDVEQGYYLTCEVTTLANGDVAITRVGAKRWAGDIWYTLTPGELDTHDPDSIWFDRQVEVIKSETFLTSVQETVRAATLDEAEEKLQVPVADLTELAANPRLVIPPPPVDGESGCESWIDPDPASPAEQTGPRAAPGEVEGLQVVRDDRRGC